MESEVDHELSFQFGDISEEIADIENSQVERETRQFFDLELIEPTKKPKVMITMKTIYRLRYLKFKFSI